MKELIKSEAEKSSVENYQKLYSPQCYELGFTAGFNRCLEMAKMPNEESFEKWWSKGLQWTGLEKGAARDAWQAACQLKDVENLELKYYQEQWQSIAGAANLKHLVATVDKLEAKCKKYEEALIEIAKGDGAIDKRFMLTNCEIAQEALKDK